MTKPLEEFDGPHDPTQIAAPDPPQRCEEIRAASTARRARSGGHLELPIGSLLHVAPRLTSALAVAPSSPWHARQRARRPRRTG